MAKQYKVKDNQRLYDVWKGMRKRCYSEHHKDYRYYGKKGVVMCDEWKNSFDSFAEWAYSHGYKDSLTIERIDNSTGYCPENCTWITKSEQQQNRTDKILIEHDGKTLNLKQWCTLLMLDYAQIHYRYVQKQKNCTQISFEEIFDMNEISKAKQKGGGKRRKRVNQYDINGNLIKTWDSISSAANAGFNQSSISRCCAGKRYFKTHGGYIWKYADD